MKIWEVILSKLKSYLGLCVKSGGVVIGQDRLKKNNKKIYLLLVCPTASNNLKDLSYRLSEKFDCDCIFTNLQLEDLICKSGCKFVGITNESLANAIITQENEYSLIRSRNGK